MFNFICLALLDKFLNNLKKFSLSDLTKISLIFFFYIQNFYVAFLRMQLIKKYIFFISVSIIFILINFLLIMKKLNKKYFMSLVILSIIEFIYQIFMLNIIK